MNVRRDQSPSHGGCSSLVCRRNSVRDGFVRMADGTHPPWPPLFKGGKGRWVSLLVSCALAMLAASAELFASEPAQQPASANAPVPPKEATARIKVPDGFTVTQFAAEPDVVQPIAMTIDHRGRLWVVENYAYPIWLGGPTGRDRVLIFEDADGDGHFDRRTVFYEHGTNFTGIELGFGGVWVCSTPNLLFIPDQNGDDRPDGPPVIKLDGWSKTPQHNMFNALKWGPDGWLWGVQWNSVDFTRWQTRHAG